MHECIIGILSNYDTTDVVTLSELKNHIELSKRLCHIFHTKPYELADYCDRRKSTDLTLFDYCPKCGKKINWKSIKKGGS